MNPDAQFWWTWWVRFASAVGTFGAVLMALFGTVLRARFFAPQLRLRFVRPQGEISPVKFSDSGGLEKWGKARYYHLQVSNERRWSPAENTQVFLRRLEEPGPDGLLQVVWSGDMPMRWRHQEHFPVAQTIGPSTDCDLCMVADSGFLRFMGNSGFLVGD